MGMNSEDFDNLDLKLVNDPVGLRRMALHAVEYGQQYGLDQAEIRDLVAMVSGL